MKLTSLRFLYSKLNSTKFLHNKCTIYPSIIASNKHLTSEGRFNIKTKSAGGLDHFQSGRTINQNERNVDDIMPKYYAFDDSTHSNKHFHEIRMNSNNNIVLSQLGNDYISKQLMKGLFVIPGIVLSNPFNHLFQEDNMFLVYKILGIQPEYNILENSCDVLVRDNYYLSYSGLYNLPHNQQVYPTQNISNNHLVFTSLKMPNLSNSQQNYSCGNCRNPQESKGSGKSDVTEKDNHSGLLTCNKGGQSGQDSSSTSGDGKDEGLLTCRRVGKIIEQEKKIEEKVETVERRKELEGEWKNLCRRCIPTKDNITLARTSLWWRIINRLRGNNMDERLQRYLGNAPAPFIRKSLAERRKELGEDFPKPVVKCIRIGKKRVKKTAVLPRKYEKSNQPTGDLTLDDRKLNQQTEELNKKLDQQTGELNIVNRELNHQTGLTLDNKLNNRIEELTLEDKKMNKQIEELSGESKKLKRDIVG